MRVGQVRPFCRRAEGLVRGEGGGAVLLKRFNREDECAMLLVGSSVSSDAAALPPGFPDCQAQQRAIREALGKAGLSADVVSYTLSSYKGNAGHMFLTSDVLALIKVNQHKPARSSCSVFCRLHTGWY